MQAILNSVQDLCESVLVTNRALGHKQSTKIKVKVQVKYSIFI